RRTGSLGSKAAKSRRVAPATDLSDGPYLLTAHDAAARRSGMSRGGSLAGTRVLDLTGEPGFFAGKLLGDLGADVVKLEPPAGDPARRRPPFWGGTPDLERALA